MFRPKNISEGLPKKEQVLLSMWMDWWTACGWARPPSQHGYAPETDRDESTELWMGENHSEMCPTGLIDKGTSGTTWTICSIEGGGRKKIGKEIRPQAKAKADRHGEGMAKRREQRLSLLAALGILCSCAKEEQE